MAEGMCKRCAGTGFGEDVADLGEAYFDGTELPVAKCKACGGSGMARDRSEASAFGSALLIALLAVFWACPAGSRWILMLSLLSIAVLQSAWRFYHRRTFHEPAAKAVVEAPSASTEGLLALHAALERHRVKKDKTPIAADSSPVTGSPTGPRP